MKREGWYVVKRNSGHCEVLPSTEPEGSQDQPALQEWGPFESQAEAIAHRVGLIRAGKCQPVQPS